MLERKAFGVVLPLDEAKALLDALDIVLMPSEGERAAAGELQMRLENNEKKLGLLKAFQKQLVEKVREATYG